MEKTVSGIFKKTICCMAIALALVAGAAMTPAYAVSHGIYTATAASHYKHPVTGVIEDSGGESSYVLGQSMTESALDTHALVEVDTEGNTFATIRLKLMDNIKNPSFQVDEQDVEASIMQEDAANNTADYRMRVDSEDSIIRCGMYVIPMGRDVVFYITLSDLEAAGENDAGDFITSIRIDPNYVGQPNESVQSEQPQAPVETLQPETTQSAETSNNKGGLQEYDENGNLIGSEGQDTGSADNGVIWIVIGSIGAVAVVGFCIWYFGFFKKRR